MAIASLVLGIVGLVASFIPCLGMYALPLTLIGVILGALAMRKPKDGSPQKGKGMAIAGLICGILGSAVAAYQIYAWQKFKAAAEKGDFSGYGVDIKKELDKAAADMKKKDIDKDMKDVKDQVPAPKDDGSADGSAKPE